MKKTFKFLSMAALALVGAIITGCSNEDDIVLQQPQENNVVTLTTTINLAGNETRALDEHGVKTFAVGDQIAVVYTNTSSQTVKATSVALTSPDITNSGKSATFTVTLENPVAGTVDYVYPAAMANDDGTMASIANQDGTLATIQSKYDYTRGSGTMTISGSDVALPTGITLTNQLAIAKFTIKESAGNTNITSSVTKFAVVNGDDVYTINRTATADPVYVAMKPVTNGDIDLGATAGANNYSKTVTGKTLTAGSLYPITVTMNAFNPKAIPLTLEAKEAGATVIFKLASGVTGVEYSNDGTNWFSYTSATPITLTNVGDKVMFRGNNESYYRDERCINCNADCYVYGNIMSLISSEGFAIATEVQSNAFQYFFEVNTHIFSHAITPLVLPATTLGRACYSNMFKGCTSLTTAPELPATILADFCYGNMFQNCTSLITAPELPATMLGTTCYCSMFQGCTSLTTAPELPATTLRPNCYYSMFQGCTSLTTVPELPATTLTSGCYRQMFQGCTSLTTAPELPATTLANASDCYRQMFQDCTSLTTAPELPATTLYFDCYYSMFQGCTKLVTAPILPARYLDQACYQQMFMGCTSLNSVTCLATDITATNCLHYWLSGVAANGTLKIHYTLDPANPTPWVTDSYNGIPSGWTVQTYVAP